MVRDTANPGHAQYAVIPCYEGVLYRNDNIRPGTNTVGTPLRYETRIRPRAHYLVAVIASLRGDRKLTGKV